MSKMIGVTLGLIVDVPRTLKEKSFVGLHGLTCITHPNFIREGSLLGKNIGL